MRDRLQPILDKASGVALAAWGHLGLLKYLLVAVVLTVLALVVSLVIWSRVRPLSDYQTVIETQLQKQLHADVFKMKDVHWAWDWKTLSIGIQGRDVVYKDSARRIEGSIPKLKIFWTPVKLAVGSLSIVADVENSTWQVSTFASEPEGAPIELRASVLKAAKQPSFWQRRWDFKVRGHKLNVAADVGPGIPLILSKADVEFSLMGLRSHFEGSLTAGIAKQSALGHVDGRLFLGWKGVFQYVDRALVGISVDEVRVDYSDSTIEGWGLHKQKHDPLHAIFGLQMLLDEEGEFSTVDIKEGQLKFADLDFVFYGDQKNASGAAWKWILKNQQFQRNKLPFQIIHPAKISGPVQAEGRVAVSKGWDFAAAWVLKANGLNFKAADLAEHFDPRSEGNVVLNLAFEGGYQREKLYSSGLQLKIDARDAHLVSRSRAFQKPQGQAAQIQLLFDVQNDLLTLKPSFVEWAKFRGDFSGRIESLSEYLLRDREAPFHLEARTSRLDIGKMAPFLGFLKQNPVPRGTLEFAGSLSGAFGKKSLAKQFTDREIAWRVDQLALSDFTAGADSGTWFADAKTKGTYVDGVVDLGLSLRARGRGSLVQSSNLQADINVTDAEFVLGDEFRKLRNVPAKLSVGLRSVPNRIEFRPSRLSFLDNDIDFSGDLNQGGRSKMALSFSRAIDLAKWRGFFRAREDIPLEGTVQPKLFLSLASPPQDMDSGIDWRRVGLAGTLQLKNLRGLLGPLSVVDRSSGDMLLGRGRITLKDLQTFVGTQKLKVSGNLEPVGQSGDVSFYDVALAKSWKADLQIAAAALDVGQLLRGLHPAMATQGNRERSPNSVEPRTWLNPEEIESFKAWPLLAKVQLESRWSVAALRFGSWNLKNFRGTVGIAQHKLRYSVAESAWNAGARLVGSGVMELKPRGRQQGTLPIAGTWNWERVPLAELLQAWDLRDAKVIKGIYSGSTTYALEKSSLKDTDDVTRINLDGQIKSANHHALAALLGKEVKKLPVALGVSRAACEVSEWQGSLKAWANESGALHVDEAKWSQDGSAGSTRLTWQLMANQKDEADLRGQWLPGGACAAAAWQKCAAQLSPENRKEMGRFVVKGPWDRLGFAWAGSAWRDVQNCQPAAEGATSVRQPSQASDDGLSRDELKDYFKKNAN